MSELSDVNIIKLGGSLLTDKSTPYKMRKEIFEQLARELRESFRDERLLIIHGVGSYGHPPVKKYELYKGYAGGKNLHHLADTQTIVFQLRIEFVKALQDAGLNAMIFLPSSAIISENMVIKEFFVEPLKGFLKLGMVPVIGGDMVFDVKMGYSVCSGDQVAVYLAKELHAKRLIFAMDIDGIYTSDPNEDASARLIQTLSLEELETQARVTESKYVDVTKGMVGKIEAIKKYRDLLDQGTEIVFLSMMRYGNLKNYIENSPNARYTKIIK